MISADQVADTLALLIPGFVALKVFYWFGQRTKRADWEWTLWSVLVAAPIAYCANFLASRADSSGDSISKAAATCALTGTAGKTGADFTAAVSTCLDQAINGHHADLRLLIAMIISVVVGLLGVGAWNLATRTWPWLRDRAALDAWDAVMQAETGPWVQVLVDGLIYSGQVRYAADSTETDNVDLYIDHPAIVDGETLTELAQTEGVLIARDKITWLQVLAPVPDP